MYKRQASTSCSRRPPHPAPPRGKERGEAGDGEGEDGSGRGSGEERESAGREVVGRSGGGGVRRVASEGMRWAVAALWLATARARPREPSEHIRHEGDEIVYIGCFAEMPADSGEHDIPGWQQAVVRPPANTESCAMRCMHSTYFALQAGVCQCTSAFGSTPNTQRLREASECGAPCAGEEGLQPPRLCGLSDAQGKRRNAWYTRTRCALGARFVVDKQLDNDRYGIKQWQAKILLDEWEDGARIVLDWGDVRDF